MISNTITLTVTGQPLGTEYVAVALDYLNRNYSPCGNKTGTCTCTV